MRKIIKVVYFDEFSAIDYLDLYNGGLKTQTKEKKAKTEDKEGIGGSIEANTGVFFRALKPLLNIDVNAGANAHVSRIGESVIQTTIINTLLSDYIQSTENDDNVEKLEGYIAHALNNSISFFKMYTPYLKMINKEYNEINISNMDEVLERGKGYYELIAENNLGKKIILRFNIKSFRNNYNLSDITKMNLIYYSIKVGKMSIEDLDTDNEFNFNDDKSLISTEEILDVDSAEEKKKVDFYDVILAGIIGNRK